MATADPNPAELWATGPVVYLVSDGCGRVKIGRSVNLVGRICTLQTASSERLTVVGVVPETLLSEATAHELAASHRLHGEWFAEEAIGALDQELLGRFVGYRGRNGETLPLPFDATMASKERQRTAPRARPKTRAATKTRLAWTLRRSGVPEHEFAAAVGCSPAHLVRLLAGERTPGLALAVRIEMLTEGMLGGPVRAREWLPEAELDLGELPAWAKSEEPRPVVVQRPMVVTPAPAPAPACPRLTSIVCVEEAGREQFAVVREAGGGRERLSTHASLEEAERAARAHDARLLARAV